jgi:hypothetical protein
MYLFLGCIEVFHSGVANLTFLFSLTVIDPPVKHSSQDIVQCSLIQCVDAKLVQEENMDNLCNEAFDELLTQEFNPDGDDFEDDSRSEADHSEEASRSEANLSEEAGKCLLI